MVVWEQARGRASSHSSGVYTVDHEGSARGKERIKEEQEGRWGVQGPRCCSSLSQPSLVSSCTANGLTRGRHSSLSSSVLQLLLRVVVGKEARPRELNSEEPPVAGCSQSHRAQSR